jgi:HlyD family secretion protein
MEWGIRRQACIGLAVVVGLVLFIGVWGTMARLAGAIVATGRIEPTDHVQVVQHEDGGIVATIEITDGDTVRQGDILLTLDGSTLRAELAIVAAQLRAIEAEVVRLKAEQAGATRLIFPGALLDAATADDNVAELVTRQTQLFEARLGTYEETIRSLREQQQQRRSETEGLVLQQVSLDRQLTSIEADLQDASSLRDKGLVLSSRVRELERSQSELEGQSAAIRASEASARSEVARIDVEILKLSAQRQEEATASLRDLEARETELLERQRDYEARVARLSLRSPTDGTIHDLKVHTVGAVIREAEPVVYVVPTGQDLTVKAEIDATRVDSLVTNQTVVLRFTSFDARTTPEVRGTLRRFSPDTVKDERSGLEFYTADITVAAPELDKLEGKTLIPGMPVEVQIQTGSHAPLDYMLRPFLDFVERAMKE